MGALIRLFHALEAAWMCLTGWRPTEYQRDDRAAIVYQTPSGEWYWNAFDRSVHLSSFDSPIGAARRADRREG